MMRAKNTNGDNDDGDAAKRTRDDYEHGERGTKQRNVIECMVRDAHFVMHSS